LHIHSKKITAGRDIPRKAGLLALSVAALGVVYGDIGTSPLYTMKETFFGAHPLARSPENVLGVLSLIFWTLLLIVGVKYVLLVMRADLHGEGGIFALLGIIREKEKMLEHGRSPRVMWVITTAVMIGSASLYGEGVITPAISVLSAYEGLEVITSAFKPAVVWLTVITLLLLFLFQSRGTASVGKTFGPIMVVWFLSIGAAPIPSCSGRSIPSMACNLSPPTASRSSLCSEPWCLPSPASRRSSRTWATSGAGRSDFHGTDSSFPACSSITSARAHAFWIAPLFPTIMFSIPFFRSRRRSSIWR
jgi:K+ transporter